MAHLTLHRFRVGSRLNQPCRVRGTQASPVHMQPQRFGCWFDVPPRNVLVIHWLACLNALKNLMRAITCGATPIVAAEALVLGVDQSPRQNRSSTVMLSAWMQRHFSPINSETRNPVHTHKQHGSVRLGNECEQCMKLLGRDGRFRLARTLIQWQAQSIQGVPNQVGHTNELLEDFRP